MTIQELQLIFIENAKQLNTGLQPKDVIYPINAETIGTIKFSDSLSAMVFTEGSEVTGVELLATPTRSLTDNANVILCYNLLIGIVAGFDKQQTNKVLQCLGMFNQTYKNGKMFVMGGFNFSARVLKGILKLSIMTRQ